MEDEEACRAAKWAHHDGEGTVENAPLQPHQNMPIIPEAHQNQGAMIPGSQDAYMSGTGMQYAPNSYSKGSNYDSYQPPTVPAQQPGDYDSSVQTIRGDAPPRGPEDQSGGQKGPYQGNENGPSSKVQNNIPDDTRSVDPGGEEKRGKTLPRYAKSGVTAQGRKAQVVQRQKGIHPEQVQGEDCNAPWFWERRYWQSVKSLNAEITKLTRENDGLQSTLASAQENVRRMEQVHDDYIAAQKKISKLEAQNDLLNKLQQSQESQVRKAQELILKSNTASQIGLGDDDRTIRLNFKALLISIRDWGRDWAIGDITIIQKLEEPERAKIMKYLAKVVRIDDDELPKGMTSSKKMAARSPALCLSALLANEICDSIIGQPFATLSASSSDPRAPKTSIIPEGDTTIDSIYQNLTNCNEEKAQAWRRQTLEIFDPSVSKDAKDSLAQNAARNRRWNMAYDITLVFLSGPAVLLLRNLADSGVSDKRKENLRRIFKEALEIAGRLWKQPTIVKCKLFGDLIMDPFAFRSEFMEAHPLHQLGFGDEEEDEEEDETRLDGHRIMMVVSPTILALGNSDGENYIQHRVWAKGIVWLEE